MTRLACMVLWCQKGQLTKWGSNFVLQCVETNPRSPRCLCLVWSCNKIWGPGLRCHSSTGSPGKSSHPAPLSILWGTLRNPVCVCVCCSEWWGHSSDALHITPSGPILTPNPWEATVVKVKVKELRRTHDNSLIKVQQFKSGLEIWNPLVLSHTYFFFT